jgi:hypothetical protein
MTMGSALDRVLNDDLRFFESSGRKYRVRLASQAEVEEHAVTGGRVLAPSKWPAEMGRPRVYQAVCSIEPGVLRRLFVVAPEGMPTDGLSEDQAQALFERIIAEAERCPSNLTCH